MEPLKLIRRDLPLEPGRTLAFTFTIRYRVPLDEESGYADEPPTLENVQEWLSGCKGDDSERLWAGIKTHYSPPEMVEHEVTLADADADRFEMTWEQREREQGRAEQWASREWLDEIPPVVSHWVEGAPKVTPDGGALQ